MDNIVRERTELEDKIYKDVQSEIFKYYDNDGVEYKDNDDPETTIVDFIAYLFRLIPVVKRNVHYSEELLCKINSNTISNEHLEILKKYENAFLLGNDMNIFLSNKTKKARETDFLRYTWHLFHLHLSGKFIEDKQQMKNNRSDTQLLCIINPKDVYFVDVIPHPANAENYFDLRVLEIIKNNNWMEKIGFFEMTDMIPGSLEPKITSSKDIFTLYSKCSVNIAFEFQEKGYCSLTPMNSMRRPYEAVDEMTKIRKKIYMLDDLKESYMGFQFACDYDGFLMGLVKFKTPSGMMALYNIF